MVILLNALLSLSILGVGRVWWITLAPTSPSVPAVTSIVDAGPVNLTYIVVA